MAVRKLREELTPFDAPRVTGNIEGCVAAPSPARMLQRRLHFQASGAIARKPGQWSTRSSLALIVSGSCALWLSILTATAEVMRAVV